MADQIFDLTSYSARQLIHTTYDTTTFLRGDNQFTHILTHFIKVEQPDNSDKDFYAVRGQHGIWMGIGTDNKTHGIYSTSLANWIIRVDPDTTDIQFLGNAATASQLSNTPNNAIQFLRADNVWTNSLEGPFNSTSSQIFTFEYLGYDNVTHTYTGYANQRGSLSINNTGLILTLPNGSNDNTNVPLKFFVKNAYDNSYATIESLNLITHDTSEFTGTTSSVNGLTLREVARNGEANLTDTYAPRLGFYWQQTTPVSGALFMDANGKFNLVSHNTMASLGAIADKAEKAKYDEDGINDIRYQYVRVYNSNKVKQAANDNPGLNQSLTVDTMAYYGNSLGTIYSGTNNPTGGNKQINCITISQTTNEQAAFTSQLAINPIATTFYIRSVSTANIAYATWRQIPTFTANTRIGSQTKPVYIRDNGSIDTIASYEGNAATASKLYAAATLWGNSFTGENGQTLNGKISINNDDIEISNSGTITRQIRWIVGTNDYARIAAGATASNGGWMEIATADDGNEPIYVRQYTGEYSTITRTLTLLNASGNSIFPGSITASNGGFIGDLNGTASIASKLSSNAGTNQKPVYFSGGVPVQCNDTLAVNITGNANTATTASAVDWSNVTNKPGTSGSTATIPWGSVSGKPSRALCSTEVDGGAAAYLALENITNNGGEINFDTGVSNPIRNIYFNAHHRYTLANSTSSLSGQQPTSSEEVRYYFCSYRGTASADSYSNAYVYAGRVYNAYWNDYAEFRTTIYATPGHVVVDRDDGSLMLTNKRLMPGAQIITDTYGHAMGESPKEKTPIAVAGRVLAYPYRDKSEYHAGMAVCSAPNGTVDIMSKLEIILHPDCIIGFVSEIPSYKKWGNVEVNNRIWIKLR